MRIDAYIRQWEFERIAYWRLVSPGGINPMTGKPPPFPSHMRSSGLDRMTRGLTTLQREWIARFGRPESIGYPT